MRKSKMITENSINTQKILIFQQNGSGESKIIGVRKYGGDNFILEVKSLTTSLPAVIDDAKNHLPVDIQADLVLDFLNHPDLSHDLVALCQNKKIPIIASGKKTNNSWAFTPPT